MPAPVSAPVASAPALPAIQPGKPSTTLIPRDVLYGNPERANVMISPDGKQLSWAAPNNGVLNLWVAPVGKLDQARAVTSQTQRPIRDYGWTYSSRYLVYLQDAGGDENDHVFRVDLASGKTTDLTPYAGARAILAGQSPKQPGTIMVALNDRDKKVFDLYSLDLATGKRTLVAENTEGFAGWLVDDDLRLRGGQKKLPDGSDQLVFVDDSPSGKAAAKPGKPSWKVFDSVPFEDSDTTSVVGFAPGGKALYMLDSRGRDTAALVSIDLATKQRQLIAEDARVDIDSVMLHPAKHSVDAVKLNYLRPSWKIVDPAVQADLDALAKINDGEIDIRSRPLDDKTWVVLFTSDHMAPRYYLWDRKAKKETFLFATQPKLENLPLSTMEPVEIKSRDGKTLVSYLTLPHGDATAHRPAQPVPLVLLVHGGPWSRNTWGFSSFHQLLADRGYAVLSVNFRGSTGFGKQFLNAGNLQWGKAMHDDLIDAVGWAVQEKITRKDTVCIMGGSYGGYATLAGLTLTPDVFRCGVDLFGPSNLMTLLATIPPYWAPLVSLFHARMGDPETPDGKALLTAASPLTHVAAITRPLLIAQGANDPRVKLSESQQIVDAMKARHLPVVYAVFPDEGHGFARPENNIAFAGVAEAFLAQHLGGSYQPLTPAELGASSMQVQEGRALVPGLPAN